jgi:hypothetical protein
LTGFAAEKNALKNVSRETLIAGIRIFTGQIDIRPYTFRPFLQIQIGALTVGFYRLILLLIIVFLPI